MKISEYFTEELELIHNNTLREIVAATLDASPECIVHIPASSSGKYHPSYSLGEGGLMRHVKAAVGIAKCMIDTDIFTDMILGTDYKCSTVTHEFWDERETLADIAYAALILHDCCKPDNTPKHTTRFDHPLKAAELFKETAKKYLTKDNVNAMKTIIVAVHGCISSHMGQWNTAPYAKGVILPRPITQIEQFVHMCDYLGSRRFLEFNFEKYN